MTLDDLDLPTLHDAARAADAAGELQPGQRDLIAQRRWLDLLVPRALGGLETDLPAAVRLEEALAQADGSLAWAVTLCAGAGWFLGFLPPDVAAGIAATPGCCLTGSGAPLGFADPEGEAGWRVTGRWPYASGAPLATHFTFNAVLRAHGQPLRDANGQPRVRSFVVPASQVRVERTWQAMGLRGSDTHGFAIDSVRVSRAQSWDVTEGAVAPGPLYRFPFASLAYATLAANVGGMARGFLAHAAPLLAHRAAQGRSTAQAEQDALGAARDHLYRVLGAQWAQVVAGMHAIDEAALRDASLAWVSAARQAVDAVYPLCGLRAADVRSDVNRAWRDFHTGAQHALLAP